MPLLAKAKRKAPAKQRSQEHHTSFHNSHKNPVNIHGIYSFCYNFVPEGQQALDEQPSFGGVQRQIDAHLPGVAVRNSGAEFFLGEVFGVAPGVEIAVAEIHRIRAVLHGGAQRLKAAGGGKKLRCHQR